MTPNTIFDVLARIDRQGRDECWPWTGGTNRNGYGEVWFAARQHLAHRLVAQWFVGDVADRIVRHSCDNPPCCNPRHLLIGTHAENQREKAERGRSARGEGHPAAKLTEDDVHDLRRSVAAGETQAAVAARLGVSYVTVSAIIRGRLWAWLVTEGVA